MPRPEDLTPGAIYALGLLREGGAISRAEAIETAATHHVGPGEVVQGFQALQRHGIVREEGGGWRLTVYGEQFERDWAARRKVGSSLRRRPVKPAD